MDTPSPAIVALLTHFKSYFPLAAGERAAVARRFTERRIKRRGLLLHQGEVCRHVTFVVAGCLKLYAVARTGKEHNLQFAAEQEWLADLASFYSEQPSGLYIEAVEPTTVLQIEHADLLELYIRYHKFDRNFRILVERQYIALQHWVLQGLSATAEERYTYFLTHYPHWASRLPGTQIASYLGITPEFLSKIRRRQASPVKRGLNLG